VTAAKKRRWHPTEDRGRRLQQCVEQQKAAFEKVERGFTRVPKSTKEEKGKANDVRFASGSLLARGPEDESVQAFVTCYMCQEVTQSAD